MNTSYYLIKKPFLEKNQWEGEVSLLSFVSNGNNINTKEKALSIELFENYGLWATT